MLKRMIIILTIILVIAVCFYDLTHLNMYEVAMLSLKGENITWNDFLWLKGEDVGSGLYIVEYPINDAYSLRVGSGSGFMLFQKPAYVHLVSLENGTWVHLKDADFWDILF